MALLYILLSGLLALSCWSLFKRNIFKVRSIVSRNLSLLTCRQKDSPRSKAPNCGLPPRLLNQRPFGIDRLERIFRANSEARRMELFLFHFRQWGTTLEHTFLGTRALATIEPRNLEVMLSTNIEHWSMGSRHEVMYPFFRDGIFTQEGAAWKQSRDLLRPHFVHKQYEDLEVFRGPVGDLFEAMPKTGIVDLQPYLFRLTLDITTAFLFGESVKSLSSVATGDQSDFADAFNVAQAYVAKRMRLQDLYWLIGGRRFREACTTVHDFADGIIERALARDKTEAEAQAQNKYVFLDFLAQKSVDRAALRSQIINILVAGRDTTACLISWTVFLLVRHPKVLQKLKEDIRSSLGDEVNITRTDIRKLGYLRNVLKANESNILSFKNTDLTSYTFSSTTLSFRPLNLRMAMQDTLLPVGGGPDLSQPVFVRKGTAVAYCVYAMHRRPDFYGMDAELFRPERWEEHMPLQDGNTNFNWGYLPFNAGPRICLGMDFGVTEAAYTVIRLIRRFPNMRLPPDSKVELVGAEKQTMTLVLSITQGCVVQLDP